MANRLPLLDRVRLRLQRDVSEPFQHRVLAPLRRIRNARSVYEPIFVAGASGSGTSFLTMALSERFDCAGFVYEMDVQVSKSSVLSVPVLEEFESIAHYRDVVFPGDTWSPEAAREDVLDVCRSYASRSDGVMILKGPDIHLPRAGFMRRCFPDARFVLIFRDPAANIEGMRRKWSLFGREPLSQTVDLYRDLHEAFLRDADAFPDQVVGLPYESLVADPDTHFARIGERFGLAPASRRRRLPTSPNIEGQGVRNVRGGRIQVVRDASQRARARLDPPELQQIDDALSPLHERMLAAPYTLRD